MNFKKSAKISNQGTLSDTFPNGNVFDYDLFNLINDYVLIINKNGTIIWSNNSFNQHYSVKPKTTFHEFLFRDEYEHFNRFINESEIIHLRLKKAATVEWITWKKKVQIQNGSFPIILTGTPYHLLKVDETYFNELSNAASFGFCEYSLSDKIIYLNPSICKILGFALNEKQIHIEDYIKMVHPVDNLNFVNWFNQSCKSDTLEHLEYRIIDQNDKIKYIKSYVKNTSPANSPLLRRSVYLQDLTFLKNTLNHYKYSELRFRGIFNNSPIGMLHINTNGDIIDVNEVGLKVLGSPSKEETMKINVLKFPLLRNIGISQKIDNCIRHGEKSSFIKVYTSKWGKESHLKFHIAPLLDNNQVTIGVILMAEDLTKQANTEQELSESETRYLQTLKLIPDTIIVLDFDMQIIDFHTSTNQNNLFSENSPYKHLKDTVPADVYNLLSTKARQVIETNEATDFNFKITLDDKLLYFESRILKLDQKKLITVLREVTEQNLITIKLAENENRLKEASQIAQLGWYEVIGTEEYYYGSGQTHQIFFDEDLGNPINKETLISAIHPEDKSHFFNAVESNIKNKSDSFTWEYRIITRKNRLKYIWSKTFLVFDHNSNLTRRFGVVQDITEQKLTELALAKSQNRLFEAQRIAKVGWYEVNIDTKQYMGSSETYQIYFDNPRTFSCSEDKLIELIHEDDREYFIKHLKMTIENKSEEANFQYRIITPKNNIKHILVKANSTFNHEGTCIRRFGVVQDITSQVTAEKAKLESEARFRSIFMNSPAGIISFNHDGNYTLCNNTIYQLFNLSKDNNLSKLNLFTDPNISKQNIRQIKAGKTILFEALADYSFLSGKKIKQKETKFFEYRISPIDAESDTAGYIALITDVTQRKLMEREFIEAKNKAEDADRLKSAFLANMSHEIRTPLNAILGFSSLLESDDFTKEEQNEFINTINNNGQLLLNIINDIIDFSKIEANQLTLNRTKVQINHVLKEIQSLMKNLVPNGVEFYFETSLPDDQAVIYTDDHRLTQILINLINNAFKFTENGFVKYRYILNETKNMVIFSVQDTGCGIASEKVTEVFQRFHQLNPIKQGAGLGLSICKGLVILLGGNIWLDSELGRGSNFYFSLPYLTEKPE